MNDKSELFTVSSVHGTGLSRRIGDMEFLRSWLVYDSQIQTGLRRGRVNWNLVAGVVLTIAVSASFWAGVGLMIARIWK